jgi:SNF2 family DNA or RNA helicase
LITLSEGAFYDSQGHEKIRLTIRDILKREEEVLGSFPDYSISDSFWDLTFSLEKTSQIPISLTLKLTLKNKGHVIEAMIPPHIQSDYFVVKSKVLPIRETDFTMMDSFCKNFKGSELSPLSISKLVAIEKFFMDSAIELGNLEYRNEFLADQNHASTSENLLEVTPYPYQSIGIEWMRAQKMLGMPGVILGDVMGLGKTLQVIGFIAGEVSLGKCDNLVICPSTLVENWRREFVKFAPWLTPYIHFGPQRAGTTRKLLNHELVITTYETLVNDFAILSTIDWNSVSLDEAQFIKNSHAKRSQRSKGLKKLFGIAITGTPLENRLNDLWSLSEFASPRTFGSESEFQDTYAGSDTGASQVHSLIKPFLLRRRLGDIEHQLPDLLIQDHPLIWPEELNSFYESVRQEALAEFPVAGGLVATQRLKSLTTHPRLAGLVTSSLSELSPKYALTLQILEELFNNGEKALIFCGSVKMINDMVDELKYSYRDSFVGKLDGSIPIGDRSSLIDEFNAFPGPGVLICNPSVAGAGLNITGANHVIHYTLEWNPAKEDQSTFRVYRNGQLRNAFVHRMYYLNTIDEVIDDRIQSKRKLADLSVDAGMSSEDWKSCIMITPVEPEVLSDAEDLPHLEIDKSDERDDSSG